jgi:hypothetical protein
MTLLGKVFEHQAEWENGRESNQQEGNYGPNVKIEF